MLENALQKYLVSQLEQWWTFLVVQWLRLCASTAGAWIGSLIGKVLHALGCSQKKLIQWYFSYILLKIKICGVIAMAPHSSTLAWKIPWTEEPGGLQSMGSLRVGHDWVTSLSLFTFMHWRRKWQSTPVFLPGESQGLGSLVGCRLWGRTESDTTEVT